VISRPRPGEEVNGDGYFIAEGEDEILVSVIDGLGHGQGAYNAAQAALDILEQWDGESVGDVLAAANDALKATRGAVMGVAMINRRAGELQFAGVGNIEARLYNGLKHLSPTSVYGTLGGRFAQPRIWKSEWTANSALIMTSDGLSSSWTIDMYPELMRRTPQLIAGVLMRDMARDSDDATVLVIR
jgi:serine/threonine protein phosphatase PrpC